MHTNFWTKKRLVELSLQDSIRVVEKLRQGDLDIEVPIRHAEQMTIEFQGKARTLLWLVEHHPAKIEALMDTIEPGSPLFAALVTVYNYPDHLEAILAAVKKTNDHIQSACIEGLKRYRQPMQVRPIRRMLVRH